MTTTRTNDGLESATLGIGTERDKSHGVCFAQKVIPDHQLIAAYESNWMARGLVDIPVMDSLRKGRTWSSDQDDKIIDEEKRLNVPRKLMQAFKKGRLFGGAALYIGTDQEPDEPLDVDKIGLGGVKFLNVMTRLQLTAGEIDVDPMSEYYGTPKDYRISARDGDVTIHPSRLVIFNGDERADAIYGRTGGNWPGVSVLQATHDALANAQGIQSSIASLVYEANIDVLGIPDLMSNIGNDGYESKILKRAALFALSKGINGMAVMDANETLTRHAANFNSLANLMEISATFVAAAGQIPATRFLAQSPTGIVATGEADMDNYHDLLQSKQVLELGPAIHLLDRCLIRSSLGTSEPVPYTWNPLSQMDEKELSAIGKETIETLQIMQDMGLYTNEDIRELTTHKLQESGVMPHIESIVAETMAGLELEPINDPDAGEVEEAGS